MFRYPYLISLLATVLIGITILLSVLFSSLPFNPTRSALDLQKTVFTFLPQGWAFFTRSPREAQVILYEVTDQGLERVHHKHSSLYNLIGLNRRSTALMSELQYFKMRISERDYINTEWNYQRDLFGDLPKTTTELTNMYSDPILCGEYLLVFQEPVPWAWLDSVEEIKMPAKVIRLHISCQE